LYSKTPRPELKNLISEAVFNIFYFSNISVLLCLLLCQAQIEKIF
jgi:hypothetical protein